MRKKINAVIYMILALSLISCGFIGIRRMQTESNYKNVEMAVKYSDILRISIEGEVPIEEVLSYLKEQGVTTILAKELIVASPLEADYDTLKGLSKITLVEGYILKFNYPNARDLKPDSRYIVTEEPEVAAMIAEAYKAKGMELESLEYEGTHFLEIGEYGSALTTIGVGFDEETLNKAARLGFTISPQVKNWECITDEDLENGTAYLLSELNKLEGLGPIYFSDSTVPSVEVESFNEYIEAHQLGFIEFTSNKQEGFNLLAKKTSDAGKDYKVVRLHTLEDSKREDFEVTDLMERYELALKERSIRVFLFKLPGSLDLEADVTYLTEALNNFKTILAEDGYTLSHSVPNYNLPQVPTYLSILAGLGAIMIFVLLVTELGFYKTGYTLGVIGILGYTGLIKLLPTTALQLMALFGSIVFPIYAMIKVLKEKPESIQSATCDLLKICLLSFGGVLTVIGCLSRTNFALGIDVFMGVKVAMAAPILLIAFYLIYRKHRLDFKFYKGMLDRKISYGALLVIGVLAFIVFTYVSRTGNAGTATGLERSFRQLLDNILGVRPRTKEFLIAYPALLAVLYYGYKEKYIIAVMIAAIGPISLVNTYAHIHTPIIISLIRTGYGIIIGLGIGYIAVWGIKLINKVIKKCQI